MPLKRSLENSPTEKIVTQNSKKHQTEKKMENENTAGDVFSWAQLKNVLDETLEDVARKSDLAGMKKELEEVKEENLLLKKEIKQLNSRIELIDRKTRTTNVVVNGLNSTNALSAKDEFQQLCTDVLKVNLQVGNTSMLSKKSFMFNVDSSVSVQKILAAKNKLRGRNEFIQKDYTQQEQHVRYNLRQIAKAIRTKNRSINIKHGEFNIYVDNKKYGWFNNNIIAYSDKDSDFLKNLLIDSNCNYKIIVKDSQTVRQSNFKE